MKHILVLAFALGLSAPMAQADCAYHQTNAKAEVDQTTTASVSKAAQTSSEELVLLKKQQQATADQEKAAE